jgi:hypothetical protein
VLYNRAKPLEASAGPWQTRRCCFSYEAALKQEKTDAMEPEHELADSCDKEGEWKL